MSHGAETDERVLVCHACNASVYREHLDTGLAGYVSGKLLCVYCMKEQRNGTPGAEANDDFAPLALTEALEPADDAGSTSARTAFAAPVPAEEGAARPRRPLNKTGQGATHCKTFHSKLSDEAVRHMDQQINEWLERHPEVEIKLSTSTVGMWTGKHAEPNLIVTLFY